MLKPSENEGKVENREAESASASQRHVDNWFSCSLPKHFWFDRTMAFVSYPLEQVINNFGIQVRRPGHQDAKTHPSKK